MLLTPAQSAVAPNVNWGPRLLSVRLATAREWRLLAQVLHNNFAGKFLSRGFYTTCVFFFGLLTLIIRIGVF